MKENIKNIFRSKTVKTLSLLFCLSIFAFSSDALAVWTDAPAAPPGYLPANEQDYKPVSRGAGDEFKTGKLGVATDSIPGATFGLKVGSATTAQGIDLFGKLQVNASTGGGSICFDADCKTSWGSVTAGVSQWTTNTTTNDIYNNNTSGNVGVGITAPNARLHVYRDTGNNAEIDIQSVAGANNHWGIYHDRTTSDLRFWNNTPAGEKNILTITNEGSVGIGKTAPTTALDVAGQVTATGFCLGADCKTNWSSVGPWSTVGSDIYNNNTGYVGIGTGAPTAKLDVNGTAKISGNTTIVGDLNLQSTGNITLNGTVDGTDISAVSPYFITSPGVSGQVWTSDGVNAGVWSALPASLPSGTSGQTLRNNGTGWITDSNLFNNGTNVGIGTTTPAQKLDVVGNVQASSFLYSSDRNLKENIKPLGSEAKKVLSLEGVSFDWKKDGSKSIGFIAQDVENIYPELVSTNPQTGLKSMQYAGLIAPLVEVVKSQDAKIKDLETRITNLENSVK
ncbi:tail fiber domain-containing protein [Candidatus Azambacteria bacterium]|nr:tail fiber domain-containing protein [Candidatus Azambacteria bacterium]